MNLARVEHYFAEILSRIEDRRPTVNGGFASGPLLNHQLTGSDAVEWGTVGIPPNLAIVGTVNMDESTHGFSRKVLDRAFTLEFSDINLHVWESNQASDASSLEPWPIQAWRPRATRLSQLDEVTDTDRQHIQTTIQVLTEVNRFLTLAQLQVGYRTRDEVALFMLHAEEILPLFVTSEGESVNPLDLALQMKILPRIVGGSNAIRQVILRFLGWAVDGKPLQMEEDAQQFLTQWESETRPLALAEAKYPHTAARLCLMWERLLNEGFTSFWL
jgi:5-methylcytosine-specific restriction protein B